MCNYLWEHSLRKISSRGGRVWYGLCWQLSVHEKKSQITLVFTLTLNRHAHGHSAASLLLLLLLIFPSPPPSPPPKRAISRRDAATPFPHTPRSLARPCSAMPVTNLEPCRDLASSFAMASPRAPISASYLHPSASPLLCRDQGTDKSPKPNIARVVVLDGPFFNPATPGSAHSTPSLFFSWVG